MEDHKAKMMLMLMGKPKPGSEHEEPDGDEKEPDANAEGEKASMGDFIAAVKSGDVEAACAAFHDLKEY